MANFFISGLKNLGNDCFHLKDDDTNRVRGGLWLSASAVSLVAGAAISLFGAACVASGIALCLSGFGLPLGGLTLVVFGTTLAFSGLPAGIWISTKLASHGWSDLSTKRWSMTNNIDGIPGL